jgi:hypothetical protein
MASLSNHRQIVDPEIDATMPRRITSALMSGTKSRDSGRSSLDGSSQAIALTSIATCGGKNRRSSVAGKFLEAGQPLLEETLSPQRDHLPAGIKAPGDLVVAKSLGCQQDDPGSDHISIRQRIFSSPGLQGQALLAGQFDAVWAGSRNVPPPFGGEHYPTAGQEVT